MKQVLTIVLVLITSATFSQSAKYADAMKKNIAQLENVAVNNNAAELANNFQRIADAEKTQWLPYYYAAYLTATQALLSTDNTKKDEMADKAEGLLESAEKLLGKDNSEIYVIKAMIATIRMMVDPQTRFMTYGPQIESAIKKAESLDPSNPRPVLLEAQNLFYTPEAFGGGKAAAKPLFEKAGKLFDSFKPESELSPDWGKGALNYFMQNYK